MTDVYKTEKWVLWYKDLYFRTQTTIYSSPLSIYIPNVIEQIDIGKYPKHDFVGIGNDLWKSKRLCNSLISTCSGILFIVSSKYSRLEILNME